MHEGVYGQMLLYFVHELASHNIRAQNRVQSRVVIKKPTQGITKVAMLLTPIIKGSVRNRLRIFGDIWLPRNILSNSIGPTRRLENGIDTIHYFLISILAARCSEQMIMSFVTHFPYKGMITVIGGDDFLKSII